MGITLEFYSAESEAFVSILEKWFSAETNQDEERQANELHARYPEADFSLHLRWPEDINALCQAMIAEGLSVPGSCDDLLVEELWFDGYSAWVDRISQTLPLAIAHASAYNEALRALSDLCTVSQDALERGRALLLFRLW